jgi:hypothetical protein
MKITMKIEPAHDNEIRFYDACKGAAAKLTELAEKAISDGDYEQFAGTTHDVVEDSDEAELVGQIKVSRR